MLPIAQVDWNVVATELEITNGHAARMRYSRFKSQMEGTTPTTRKPKGTTPQKRNEKPEKADKPSKKRQKKNDSKVKNEDVEASTNTDEPKIKKEDAEESYAIADKRSTAVVPRFPQLDGACDMPDTEDEPTTTVKTEPLNHGEASAKAYVKKEPLDPALKLDSFLKRENLEPAFDTVAQPHTVATTRYPAADSQSGIFLDFFTSNEELHAQKDFEQSVLGPQPAEEVAEPTAGGEQEH